MASLKNVCSFLKKVAPLELAGKWDNVGLLVEPSIYATQQINKIILRFGWILEDRFSCKLSLIFTKHDT